MSVRRRSLNDFKDMRFGYGNRKRGRKILDDKYIGMLFHRKKANKSPTKNFKGVATTNMMTNRIYRTNDLITGKRESFFEPTSPYEGLWRGNEFYSRKDVPKVRSYLKRRLYDHLYKLKHMDASLYVYQRPRNR